MNKNTRINELIGSKWFRKCALKLEEIKYKVLDKFFPNYEEVFEQNLTKKLDKELNKSHTDEERERILNNYHKRILESRKEQNSKRNRNYHINRDNPMEMMNYLKSNKMIHQKALVKNGAVYLILAALFLTGVPLYITIPITIINTLSSAINIECINLQNYNIKRLESKRDRLEEFRKRKEERDIERYKDVIPVVSQSINTSKTIPSKEEIVAQLTTREQIEQLRNFLLSYCEDDEIEKEKEKSKCQQ